MIDWARQGTPGYEVSSAGDRRFSALYATMSDGRTIEEWYQCDIKGYDPGGRNWRFGKGKPPLIGFDPDQLYELYLSLWRLWAIRHPNWMAELKTKAIAHGSLLTDRFANTNTNQARALAQILNEWF
jgi:hypothetical protein